VDVWAFKLSFDVHSLVFFGHFFPKIRQNFIQFSGHTVTEIKQMKLEFVDWPEKSV
jgi:hypothetical protein